MSSMIVIALLCALLSLSGWLALKLNVAHKDNADLRARVDSLKRQLLRMR